MLAKEIAKAADDKKGKEIVILDLTKLSSMTDYFVIVSGQAMVQTQAIANHIEGQLKKEQKRSPFSSEGFKNGRWILMDYGSVVAHIFYEEDREFYALEKLWSNAKRVKF